MKVKLVNQNYKNNYTENLLRERQIEDLQSYLYPTAIDLEEPTCLDKKLLMFCTKENNMDYKTIFRR